ncbi:MAG: hypothetical protein ACFFCW_25960 [Candidatus Hodarchaeota archaeon]
MSFEDIKITGVDKSKVYQPDPKKLLYHVYFRLSDRPPSEWGQIFEEEHRFPRHTMWRRAWVEGQYIVVHCPLDEVKDRLRDISQDVANTNKKYREYLHRQTIEQEREQQREKKEREEINKALDELDFE